MSSKYEHIRIPAQDEMDNQDPEHRATDAISGANCVPEQNTHPLQRKKGPLVGKFVILTPANEVFVGNARTRLAEARVTQLQRIGGVIAWDESTGQFTQLDLGAPRRTNTNANHVPVTDLGVVDLAEATETFLGAGNKKRIPIGGRPEVTFITKEDA